jgi:P pilus assembly chaperone PapD
MLLASLGQGRAQAPADPSGSGLLVFPTRLVFDGHKRAGEVSLTNVGRNQADFRISLVRMDMDADGGCREMPLERLPDSFNAQDMIRFSPKLVTLKPQEGQAVRIQLRLPANLPSGEFRCYMVIREVPPPPPEPTAHGPGDEPRSIAVKLTTLFGVALPLIIRHGETSATAGLSAITLDPDRKTLRLRLDRSGNASVHGDLKATFQSAGGKPQVLGEINALSVFTPNPFRNIAIPMDPAPKGAGRIQVTFSLPDAQGSAPLAAGTLEIH